MDQTYNYKACQQSARSEAFSNFSSKKSRVKMGNSRSQTFVANAKSIHQQNTLTVHGFIKSASLFIPDDIIHLCILYYSQIYQPLSFSKKFRTKETDHSAAILYNNNQLLVQNAAKYSSWNLIDMKPVKYGVFCWRFRIFPFSTDYNPDNGWFMLGVSKQSFRTIYGYMSNNIFLPRGWKYNNDDIIRKNNNKFGWKYGDFEIDLYFDVNKGQLFMRIVGDDYGGNQIKIWNIPRGNYVPHVRVQNKGIAVRCAQIPVEWYGQRKSNIFP